MVVSLETEQKLVRSKLRPEAPVFTHPLSTPESAVCPAVHLSASPNVIPVSTSFSTFYLLFLQHLLRVIDELDAENRNLLRQVSQVCPFGACSNDGMAKWFLIGLIRSLSHSHYQNGKRRDNVKEKGRTEINQAKVLAAFADMRSNHSLKNEENTPDLHVTHNVWSYSFRLWTCRRQRRQRPYATLAQIPRPVPPSRAACSSCTSATRYGGS